MLRHTPKARHDFSTIPPAPWHLHGSMLISLWRLPADELELPVASGARPLVVAGNALIATAWAQYQSGGTLSYNELLHATAVKAAGLLTPACTVTPIWVDDAIAAYGGRVLWAIPKQLADFQVNGLPEAGRQYSAAIAGRPLATARTDSGRRWFLPLRTTLWTLQNSQHGVVRTRCQVRGRLRWCRASWDLAPDSGLGYLRGRRPLISARLERLSAHFGV